MVIFNFQHSSVSVGKLDIVWRSKFGDRGRIQTGQLKATVRQDKYYIVGKLVRNRIMPGEFGDLSIANIHYQIKICHWH